MSTDTIEYDDYREIVVQYPCKCHKCHHAIGRGARAYYAKISHNGPAFIMCSIDMDEWKEQMKSEGELVT